MWACHQSTCRFNTLSTRTSRTRSQSTSRISAHLFPSRQCRRTIYHHKCIIRHHSHKIIGHSSSINSTRTSQCRSQTSCDTNNSATADNGYMTSKHHSKEVMYNSCHYQLTRSGYNGENFNPNINNRLSHLTNGGSNDLKMKSCKQGSGIEQNRNGI